MRYKIKQGCKRNMRKILVFWLVIMMVVGGMLGVVNTLGDAGKVKAEVTDDAFVSKSDTSDNTFVIDSTPPTIESTKPPADGSVSIKKPVTVVFSEPMNQTATPAAFSISPNPGGWVWTWINDYTMTGTHNDFMFGTAYTATIKTAAKDLAGNYLAEDYQWNFTASMSVYLNSPALGDVWTGGSTHTIEYEITGGVAPYTVTINYRTDGENYNLINTTTKNAEGAYTYSWGSPMIDSETVNVKIVVTDGDETESMDTSGNFEIDSTAPWIVDYTGNDAYVLPTEPIMVIFSEEMNKASVESAFSLKDADDVNVNGTFSWDGDMMCFVPNEALISIWHMNYTVTVNTNAKDKSDPGNCLDKDYSWSFMAVEGRGDFVVDLNVPSSPEKGETYPITVTVSNTGPNAEYVSGFLTVKFYESRNGETWTLITTKYLQNIGAGNSSYTSTAFTFDDYGSYYFRVEVTSNNPTDMFPGGNTQSYSILTSVDILAPLEQHNPIYINGNSDFTEANGVTSGNGTASNPYIIENWDISAGNANGIEIRSTTVYFIIRNCAIHHGEIMFEPLIHFYNVKNGKVENCTIYESFGGGIVLEYSSSNNITSNQIYNVSNGDGICLYYSSNNNISANLIYNNPWCGVGLYHSSNNNISANLIYYNSDGINLQFSLNNNISSNQIYNNGNGICLWYSSNNNIINANNIYNNYYDGICLWESSNNEIHYNNIYNNTNHGVYNRESESQYRANATHNWWGSASGPYHPSANPSGKGDNVSDNVLYDPWLNEPNPDTGAQIYPDSDGDGLPDYQELELGCDPDNPDTDGDGKIDGVDPLPTILITTPMLEKSSNPLYMKFRVWNYGTKNSNIQLASSNWVKFDKNHFSLISGEYQEVQVFLDVTTQRNAQITITDTITNLSDSINIGLDSRYSFTATSFDISVEGYNFTNYGLDWDSLSLTGFLKAFELMPYGTNVIDPIWLPVLYGLYLYAQDGGHCYGISSTSILYMENLLSLPYNTDYTFELTKNQATSNINAYQSGRQLADILYDTISARYAHLSPVEQYNIIKNSIQNGEPIMVLMTSESGGHAVVAYKIIEDSDKAMIYIYDSNHNYSTSGNLFEQSFPYIIFNFTTSKFSYLDYIEFRAREPTVTLGNVSQDMINDLISLIISMLRNNNLMAVTFECPGDLLITDIQGRKTGIVDGLVVNEIPNAYVVSSGETEVYFVPSNLGYSCKVTGTGSGDYTLKMITPETDITKICSVNSTLTTNTVDNLEIASDGDMINITASESKVYTFTVTRKTNATEEMFFVSNVTINSNVMHSYHIIDWSSLDTGNPVSLSVDKNNDGMIDAVVDLSSGMTGEEIDNLIQEQETTVGEEKLPSGISFVTILVILVVIIMLIIIGAVLVIRRKKMKTRGE